VCWAKGRPAALGDVSGALLFGSVRAELLDKAGDKGFVVREETEPADVRGFCGAEGVLISCGGVTSHADVAGRGMGKPCVAGAEGIHVDVLKREAFVSGQLIREGDLITIDGSNGNVYFGEIPMVEPEFCKRAQSFAVLGR